MDESLEQRVARLEDQMRRHKHTGNDFTTPLDAAAAAASSGWELVANTAVSSASSITISNLLGDTDKLYRIILRGIFNTAESTLYLRMNGSSSANYSYAVHKGGRSGGSGTNAIADSGASLQSELYLIDGSWKNVFLDLEIYAVSGIFREVIGSGHAYTDVDNSAKMSPSGVWTNTADEITSLVITAGQNFLEGSEYWFYKATS